MQQLQLDSNQIFHSPFFHFALHPPPMWLEAAVRTIEAALPFFLNTIEASKMLSRKQLSAAVYTCSCYLWEISLKSARDFCRLWPNQTM